MPSLFDPITLGAIEAPNRIIMAPLTRGRSTADHVPTPIMAAYYAQRASAGLTISEATGVSRQGLGWPYAPGIWNQAQIDGWAVVTDAVHRAGGRIVCQLWHMGRLVHQSFVDGDAPVSASATTAPGHAHTYAGNAPYGLARALALAELPPLIETYAEAARNAHAAGFDGVQIHAANGYLIDQFLRDGTNQRQDGYGGSVANRIRLLREITDAVCAAWSPGRVSVRLSPNGLVQGCNDSDPETLFPAAAAALGQTGIGFLELREPPPESSFARPDRPPIAPAIQAAFGRAKLVLNSDYDGARAEATLAAGSADAIAFGRPFIANPDLPRRLREGLPVASADPTTFYSRGEPGYTDYASAA